MSVNNSNFEQEFVAKRLRRVCRLTDLASYAEMDDATLNGCAGTILGMIAAKLERDRATPSPAPSPQVAPCEVSEAMIEAYLTANDAYWRKTDELPLAPHKWRNGTPSEATRVSLQAALAAAPHQGADALREALASIFSICNETREARDLQPRMTEIRSIARAALAQHQAPQQGEQQ